MPNQRFRTVERNVEPSSNSRTVSDARKRGRRGPQYDAKGQINPYIPHFIAKTPWYVRGGQEEEGGNLNRLPHQRKFSTAKNNDDDDSSRWHERALVPIDPLLDKGRTLCANCGSTVHQTKDCLERPRKLAFRFQPKGASEGESLNEDGSEATNHRDGNPKKTEWVRKTVELGFDAKRDRWAGYDVAEYEEFMRQWQERHANDGEEARGDGGDKKEDGGKGKDDKSDLDSDFEGETTDMPGQTIDTKTRTTIRNLRLREDTAKYLRRGPEDPALIYDPKTRAMRSIAPAGGNSTNAGSGFVAATSASTRVERLAWEDVSKKSLPIKATHPDTRELGAEDYEDLTRFI